MGLPSDHRKLPVADLLVLLESAKTARARADVLDDIAACDSVPLHPMILDSALNGKGWRERSNAIRALGSCRSAKAEECLLKVLGCEGMDYEKTYANASLGRLRSKKAILALYRMASSKKSDVCCSAIWALAEIGGPGVLDMMLELLKRPRGDVKSYATHGVCMLGDERAIGPMVERAKHLAARNPVGGAHGELVNIVKFLGRFADDDRVQKVFVLLRKRYWDHLTEFHQDLTPILDQWC